MSPDTWTILGWMIATFFTMLFGTILGYCVADWWMETKYPRRNVRLTPEEWEAYKLLRDYDRHLATQETDERLGRYVRKWG